MKLKFLSIMGEVNIFGILRRFSTSINMSGKDSFDGIMYSSVLHPLLEGHKISLKFRVCNEGKIRTILHAVSCAPVQKE